MLFGFICYLREVNNNSSVFIMDRRIEALYILFNACVFAKNDGKLATILGYGANSRTTISRIKEGSKVTEKTINDIWETLCDAFYMSGEGMFAVADCVAYGKNLLSELQACYGVGGDWFDGAFSALLTEDYSALPERFEKELASNLQDMKARSSEIYYGMLAYAYISYKNITPYTAAGARVLHARLHEMNEMLARLFPTNSRAYIGGQKVIETDLADEDLNVLKLIYNLREVLANYVEEDYFERYLREKGHLLDVGEDSFWLSPDEKFTAGSVVYYFSVIPTNSKLRGAYNVVKLRAASNRRDSFETIGFYNFVFLVANDKEHTQVLQITDYKTGAIGYAVYSYDYDTRVLELGFGEVAENVFDMPTMLECAALDNPQGKDKKVWAAVLNELLAEQCGGFLLEAVNASAESEFVYLKEYNVTNVVIDRERVVVCIENNEQITDFSIPVDAYPFLQKLSPLEFVSVARSKGSGELFFCWNDLGQSIPFSAFEVREG